MSDQVNFAAKTTTRATKSLIYRSAFLGDPAASFDALTLEQVKVDKPFFIEMQLQRSAAQRSKDGIDMTCISQRRKVL